MPVSDSAPMEPYLKRMSGSLVIQSGCGSSRKNLYQVKTPPRAPSTTRTARPMRSFRVAQPASRTTAMVGLPSEGLQVLDEGILLLRRQLGAVDLALVPTIAVAEEGRIELEQRPWADRRLAGEEAHPRPVVDVVAAIENLGALSGGLEEIAQARYGAVVQVRAAEPDAVEGHVRVAEGLPKVREAPRIARVERRLIHREVVRVAVETAPVGPDLLEGRDLAHVLAGELAPASAMAGRAVTQIDGGALRRLGLIDGIRILGRLQGEQPVLDAPDGCEIDGGWRGARAEGRALVALLHHGVVAVPVELHPLARLLQPYGRKVRGPVLLLLAQLPEGEVEEDLGRVEGVHAPGSPFRIRQERLEAAAQHEQALAHDGDGHGIDEVAVDQAQLLPLGAHEAVDLRQHVLGGGARILGAVEEEFLKAPHVEGVGGHAEVHARLGIRAVPHRARVAHRAVEEGAIDALVAPSRHADGQVLALFEGEAEGRPARPRQVERAHLGQRLENPVGKARLPLAARRP